MKKYSKINIKILFVAFMAIMFSSCDDTLDTTASGLRKGITLEVNTKDVNGDDITDLESVEIFDTREYSIEKTDENILTRPDGLLAVTWYFEAERFDIINNEGEAIGTPADYLGSEDNFYTSVTGMESVVVRAKKETPFEGNELEQSSRSYVEIVTDDNGKIDIETRVNLIKIFPQITPMLFISSEDNDLERKVLDGRIEGKPNTRFRLTPNISNNDFGLGRPRGMDRFLYALPKEFNILTNIETNKQISMVEYSDSLFVPNLNDPIVQKIRENQDNLQFIIVRSLENPANILFTVDEVGDYPLYFGYSRNLPLTNFITTQENPDVFDNIIGIVN